VLLRRCIVVISLVTLTVAATALGSPPPAKLALSPTSLGKVLADGRGRTLYLFESDRSRTSTCYGACTLSWRPFVSSAKPLAGAGLKASLISTSKRKDGRMQVVYAGHPLYFFLHDASAGQMKGEGMGGSWFAVSAKGTKVVPASAAAPMPDPGAGYGGGYGGMDPGGYR
jgi:predicted lipoprotein with Yx(FWY)xxD motif